MSWDLEKGNGGSNEDKLDFTKFPEGITRIRVISEMPHIRWTHWMNQHKRSVNCPGRDCPICTIRKQQKANNESYTYNMTKRFSLLVLNRETGKLEVMEQGITVMEDIRDMKDDLERKNLTLQDADLRIKRRGTGKDDTSYRVDIDEEYPLTDDDIRAMEKVTDLNEFFKPHTPEQILRLVNGESFEEVMKSDNDNQDNNTDTEEDIEVR